MTWKLEQAASYHLFADTRSWFGIANAADTLSNLGFIAVGVLGLALLWRDAALARSRCFVVPEERRAWWVLFGALVLVGFGSVWYHQVPDDARLVWDRLPMSLAFTALVSIVVSERVRLTWGLRLLPALLLAGMASVAWWQATGNLLPYACVQFGALTFVVAIVIARRSRYTHASCYFGLLACYAGAKAAEWLDAPLYSLTGVFSGHTVKHLLAAAGVLWLVRMLGLRGPR